MIYITGTDDLHYYYTEAARAALETAPEGFKVALVHSAELADVAAEAGFTSTWQVTPMAAKSVCRAGSRSSRT